MGKVTKAAIIVILSAVLLFPMYLMVMGSFQTSQHIMRIPPEVLPREFSLANYRRIFEENPVARWVTNTVALGLLYVSVSVMGATMAGYALALYRFPGRRIMHWCFVAAIAIPRLAFIIPQYVVLRQFGLGTGLIGAGFPLILFPMGVLIFRMFIEALPRSIDDAARIDGANEWQTIRYIIVPLCGPALGLLAITKGFEVIGDYLWQSLILTRGIEKTLIVGVIELMRRSGTTAGARDVNPIGMQLAGSMMLFLPMVLIFLAGQGTFRSGLTGGAVKE